MRFVNQVGTAGEALQRGAERVVIRVEEQLGLQRRAQATLDARGLDALVHNVARPTQRRPLCTKLAIAGVMRKLRPAGCEHVGGGPVVGDVLPHILGEVRKDGRSDGAECGEAGG